MCFSLDESANWDMMAARAVLKSRVCVLVSSFLKDLEKSPALRVSELTCMHNRASDNRFPGFLFIVRHVHDGRPRGALWRGKKLIGKEALFVIQGLKRFKDDEEKLEQFMKSHVLRLLKTDMAGVLCEFERQYEVTLAIKIFKVIQKQEWYKPDVYAYKDLIIASTRSRKMEEAMKLWESMKTENLYPDHHTYSEVIRGFLESGSPEDAMNIYEDMKRSPDPPEEMPFKILLRGLRPYPLLRNRVKQDFERIFPDRPVNDPPEEIFGAR